jgi:hypothetical protein
MAALSVASSINSPAAFARMRPEVIFGFRQELACYWVSAVFRLFRTSMQVESANQVRCAAAPSLAPHGPLSANAQNLLRLMTERSFVERFHVIDEHVNTIYYTIRSRLSVPSPRAPLAHVPARARTQTATLTLSAIVSLSATLTSSCRAVGPKTTSSGCQ